MTKFGPDLPLLIKMHEIWPHESQENYLNCCHQMSDFKAKMHQIRLRLTPLRELTAPPYPLAGFKGPTSKGRGGKERGGGEGRGWEGRAPVVCRLPPPG